MIRCEWCGHEGPSSEFRYLSLAEEMGPNTYRQCPECDRAVYVEELELESLGEDVWGTGRHRGKVFTRGPGEGKKGGGGDG